LAPERVPGAAGLSNFARLLAGAFGTSITTTAWDDRASMHHAHLTEIARPGEPAFDYVMQTVRNQGFTQQQGAEMVNRIIEQQAHTMSVTDIFLASSIIFLLLLGLVWIAKPIKPSADSPKPPADAH
jgi:DHA2 family multidrug resistance protein